MAIKNIALLAKQPLAAAFGVEIIGKTIEHIGDLVRGKFPDHYIDVEIGNSNTDQSGDFLWFTVDHDDHCKICLSVEDYGYAVTGGIEMVESLLDIICEMVDRHIETDGIPN